jgi:polyphosphate glucokinase
MRKLKASSKRGAAAKAGRSIAASALISQPLRTLAIDIGGSGVKVEVLDANGKPTTPRARVPVPQSPTPEAILAVIEGMVRIEGEFERISVGFPGVVKNGIVYTAHNLAPDWQRFNLARALRQKFGKPVRIANDADVQGLGSISGRSVELVITLGTGFGSSLFIDGQLVPNLQLGQHPFRKGKSYEEHLGHAAMERAGKKKWNRRLRQAIGTLSATFNYNRLYIGGGNARHIGFKLPSNVVAVSNEEGLLGGIALWRKPAPPKPIARPRTRLKVVSRRLK